MYKKNAEFQVGILIEFIFIFIYKIIQMKVLNKNQSSVLNLNESILLLRNNIYIYIIDFV